MSNLSVAISSHWGRNLPGSNLFSPFFLMGGRGGVRFNHRFDIIFILLSWPHHLTSRTRLGLVRAWLLPSAPPCNKPPPTQCLIGLWAPPQGHNSFHPARLRNTYIAWTARFPEERQLMWTWHCWVLFLTGRLSDPAFLWMYKDKLEETKRKHLTQTVLWSL